MTYVSYTLVCVPNPGMGEIRIFDSLKGETVATLTLAAAEQIGRELVHLAAIERGAASVPSPDRFDVV